LPTRCAIAAMWSGVVPQQPPAMLRKPAFANSSTRLPVTSALRQSPGVITNDERADHDPDVYAGGLRILRHRRQGPSEVRSE